MSTVNISPQLRAALRTNAYFRNGMLPSAPAQTALVDQTNFISKWRTKSCELGVPISQIPALASTNTVFRHAGMIHTSPFCKYLRIHVQMAKVALGSGGGHASGDPFVRVTAWDNSGASVIGIADFHFGATGAATVTDVPDEFGVMTGYISDSTTFQKTAVAGDTDVAIYVEDNQSSRCVSVSVWEECEDADTTNGYIAGAVQQGTPIFDADRANIVPILRDAWKRQAASLWHWTAASENAEPTRTAATYVNLLDNTTVGYSASAPGAYLYLANRSTVRRGTVPIKMWVYAGMSAAATGTVKLVNSGGDVLSVNVTGTGKAWYSGTANLAATDAKYDLQFISNGVQTLSVYGVSILQYE